MIMLGNVNITLLIFVKKTRQSKSIFKIKVTLSTNLSYILECFFQQHKANILFKHIWDVSSEKPWEFSKDKTSLKKFKKIEIVQNIFYEHNRMFQIGHELYTSICMLCFMLQGRFLLWPS